MSSTTPWSSSTVSPGFTNHLTISPSTTPSPRSGSLNSNVATALSAPRRDQSGVPALLHETLHEELGRAVAAADQRTRGDVQETHCLRQLLVPVEVGRRNEPCHAEMILRRLEVLAQGQHVHAG